MSLPARPLPCSIRVRSAGGPRRTGPQAWEPRFRPSSAPTFQGAFLGGNPANWTDHPPLPLGGLLPAEGCPSHGLCLPEKPFSGASPMHQRTAGHSRAQNHGPSKRNARGGTFPAGQCRDPDPEPLCLEPRLGVCSPCRGLRPLRPPWTPEGQCQHARPWHRDLGARPRPRRRVACRGPRSAPPPP